MGKRERNREKEKKLWIEMQKKNVKNDRIFDKNNLLYIKKGEKGPKILILSNEKKFWKWKKKQKKKGWNDHQREQNWKNRMEGDNTGKRDSINGGKRGHLNRKKKFGDLYGL